MLIPCYVEVRRMTLSRIEPQKKIMCRRRSYCGRLWSDPRLVACQYSLPGPQKRRTVVFYLRDTKHARYRPQIALRLAILSTVPCDSNVPSPPTPALLHFSSPCLYWAPERRAIAPPLWLDRSPGWMQLLRADGMT